VPCRARCQRWGRTGRGPGPDAPVAAEYALWYVLVCGRGLDGSYCLSAYACDLVPVADGVSGGPYPGDPRVPRPVSFVLFPAQQVPDRAPRSAQRWAATMACEHTAHRLGPATAVRIRNSVLSAESGRPSLDSVMWPARSPNAACA
jgi:hypothetical protein